MSAAHAGWAHEGRSPGVATLKEAFDITYAVHRMEEEGTRRRRFRAAGARGFLAGLTEDEEGDDPRIDGIEEAPKNASSKVNVLMGQPNGRVPQRGFELDLDGATLLGRRHKRALVNSSSAATVKSLNHT